MGILELLTIIFVILKLTGLITWSWWAVFIPLYVIGVVYTVWFGTFIVANVWLRREVKKEFGWVRDKNE